MDLIVGSSADVSKPDATCRAALGQWLALEEVTPLPPHPYLPFMKRPYTSTKFISFLQKRKG
jgi:hypothetical protein